MIDKGNKITIKKEQRHFFFDTKRRDNDVSCFPNGDSFFAKGAVIVGALIRHSFTKHFDTPQRLQSLLGQLVFAIVPNALKNSRKIKSPIAMEPATIPASRVSVWRFWMPLR